MTNRCVLLAVTIDDSLQFFKGYPEKLVSLGWEVHIVASSGPRLGGLAAVDGVFVHAIEMKRVPSPIHDLWALMRWIKLLMKIQPSIVSAGTPKAGLLGLIAAWLTRVPVRIYVLRGLRLETSHGLNKRVLEITEKVAAAASTSVIAVSNSLRDRVVRLGLVEQSKIRVIGAGSSNGVSLEVFDPKRFSASDITDLGASLGLDPSIRTVGFVGRLTRDKGLVELAESMRQLARQKVPVQLLVVGGVDDSSGELAREELVNLQVPVIFAGYTPDPAIYFKLMDVFCLPSYREGFSNVVLEASAMGVPVVASDAVGVVDAVDRDRTGLLVPVGSASALAAALERVLVDPALSKEMGEAGREWVMERFDRVTVQSLHAEDLLASIEA